MGPDVTLINSGREAARALQALLVSSDRLNESQSNGDTSYFVSDTVDGFEEMAGLFLRSNLKGMVQQINIEKILKTDILTGKQENTMQQQVMISIRGEQEYEGTEKDVTEFVTEGTLTSTDYGYALEYDESALTGMEGTHTAFLRFIPIPYLWCAPGAFIPR